MKATRTKIRLSRTARQLIFGFVFLLFVIGCGYAVWHYTRLPKLNITQVTVSGGVTVSEKAVAEIVRDELSGTYVGLIPRTFSYLYPERRITAAVTTVPSVKTVTLTRPDRQTLAVAFSEYKPFALWCAFEGEYCVFIDETGYAYAQAPKLQGSTFIRFFREETSVQVGHTVLSADELTKVLTFTQLLAQDFNFKTWGVVIDTYGDITYRLVGGAELLVGRDDDTTAVLENLATILQSDEFSHLTPDNFAYIDLRFGDRVYVNEEIAAPEVASSTAMEVNGETILETFEGTTTPE